MNKYLKMSGLDALLKDKGISKKWVKDKMNVSYPTLKSWEEGDSEPRYGQVVELCELLGCEKEELYLDIKTKPE